MADSTRQVLYMVAQRMTWLDSNRFRFCNSIRIRQVLPCIRRSPACLIYKVTADWKSPQQSIYQYKLLFHVRLFSVATSCRALAALGFGNLCCFALKSGRFSSTKARDLCCFPRKAIVRRHESTTAILLLRGDFACQQRVRTTLQQDISACQELS